MTRVGCVHTGVQISRDVLKLATAEVCPGEKWRYREIEGEGHTITRVWEIYAHNFSSIAYGGIL